MTLEKFNFIYIQMNAKYDMHSVDQVLPMFFVILMA